MVSSLVGVLPLMKGSPDSRKVGDRNFRDAHFERRTRPPMC